MGIAEFAKKMKRKVVGKDQYKVLVTDSNYYGELKKIILDHITPLADRVSREMPKVNIQTDGEEIDKLMKDLPKYNMIVYDWELYDKKGNQFFKEVLNHHGHEFLDRVVFTVAYHKTPAEHEEHVASIKKELDSILSEYATKKQVKVGDYEPKFVMKWANDNNAETEQRKILRRHSAAVSRDYLDNTA